NRLLRNTILSMNIKGGLLETYCKTHWVSIYDTTNSIMHVKPAIEKILKEQPNIFTNKDVYEIAFDEGDVFYISCKRVALVFEPIKQVIDFLKSHTANLADCFIEIAQIATAFKRIHP
ncbi:2512_t:CDS:2, partial [Gigaspora rosea]